MVFNLLFVFWNLFLVNILDLSDCVGLLHKNGPVQFLVLLLLLLILLLIWLQLIFMSWPESRIGWHLRGCFRSISFHRWQSTSPTVKVVSLCQYRNIYMDLSLILSMFLCLTFWPEQEFCLRSSYPLLKCCYLNSWIYLLPSSRGIWDVT